MPLEGVEGAFHQKFGNSEKRTEQKIDNLLLVMLESEKIWGVPAKQNSYMGWKLVVSVTRQ